MTYAARQPSELHQVHERDRGPVFAGPRSSVAKFNAVIVQVDGRRRQWQVQRGQCMRLLRPGRRQAAAARCQVWECIDDINDTRARSSPGGHVRTPYHVILQALFEGFCANLQPCTPETSGCRCTRTSYTLHQQPEKPVLLPVQEDDHRPNRWRVTSVYRHTRTIT